MGSGLGAAGGVGATGAVGGGSSAFKEHIQTSQERWEEQQTLLSREDYHGMAAGGRHVVGTGGSLAVGAGGTMTMEAGGLVNEEFLRSYFSDVSNLF